MFITGASSGIGRALACELAGRGYRLGLTARRLDELERLKAELDARGCDRVEIARLDVTDVEEVSHVLARVSEALDGLDVVIANAGQSSGRRVGAPGFDRDVATIRVNLIGAMATIDAAAAMFTAAGRGHLVAISSVAAIRGMPGTAAYGASKAALVNYMEAVRCELAAHGVRVTTLLPGFIDTPINRHLASRPFVVSAEVGARRIADLIERGVRTSTVPVFPWSLIAFVMRWMPRPLWDLAMSGQGSRSSRPRA